MNAWAENPGSVKPWKSEKIKRGSPDPQFRLRNSPLLLDLIDDFRHPQRPLPLSRTALPTTAPREATRPAPETSLLIFFLIKNFTNERREGEKKVAKIKSET